MKKNELKFLPLNLQLFAKEDDDPKDDDPKDDDPKDEGGNGGKDSDQNGKTFSQKDVSAMMTKEKNEGRKSVLNALGVENVEEAQKAMEFFKKFNETFNGEKTPEEIQKALEGDKSKAEQRAIDAENKLACVMAGVNKDSVDDVMAIATPKVTEDKDLSKVIEEMKSQSKYSSFFNNEDEKGKDKGTGRDPGHGREQDNNDSRAKRLAENAKGNIQKKSSYFN